MYSSTAGDVLVRSDPGHLLLLLQLLQTRQALIEMPAAAMHTPSRQPYSTKRIPCGRCSPTILLQSTNGPCPLIAIANVLALREELQFSKDVAPEALLPLLAHLMHQKATQSCSLCRLLQSLCRLLQSLCCLLQSLCHLLHALCRLLHSLCRFLHSLCRLQAQTLGGTQENQQRCTMRCGDWTVCRMA